MTHPWHDVPIGDKAPHEVRAVIEVPRGDTTKYELDKELGLLSVNRIMHPPVPYPANYGFLPRTLATDGDPLDVLVLMQNPVAPLSLVQVRPLGLFVLTDRDERDDKLICVHTDDPMYQDYTDLPELPSYERERLEWFFEDHQDTLKRDVKVSDLLGAKDAHRIVLESIERYEAHFGKRSD